MTMCTVYLELARKETSISLLVRIIIIDTAARYFPPLDLIGCLLFSWEESPREIYPTIVIII